MRKYLWVLIIYLPVVCFSQASTPVSGKISQQVTSIDSTAAALSADSLKEKAAANISLQMQDNRQQNLAFFIQEQKDRRDKEQKASLLRIGVGAVLLIILFFGWQRKRAAKPD